MCDFLDKNASGRYDLEYWLSSFVRILYSLNIHVVSDIIDCVIDLITGCRDVRVVYSVLCLRGGAAV